MNKNNPFHPPAILNLTKKYGLHHERDFGEDYKLENFTLIKFSFNFAIPFPTLFSHCVTRYVIKKALCLSRRFGKNMEHK